MALTCHSAIWSESSNDNVNTTIEPAEFQLNRLTASCLGDRRCDWCQDPSDTDP